MKMKLNENGLNIKQQTFIEEYLANGFNAKAAYKTAYPKAKDSTCKTNGCLLLQDPTIKTYLDKKLKEIEDAKIATAKERLQFYTSVLRGEENDEVIFLTEDGIIKESKKASIRDRIRAGEIMDRIENIGGINKQEVTISPFLEDALYQLFGTGESEEEEDGEEI